MSLLSHVGQIKRVIDGDGEGRAAAVLIALGIVFGDIGTSPLYALRYSLLLAGHPLPVRADVLGIVSLILWALMLVVSLKYVVFILRADDRGEGGTIALIALLNAHRAKPWTGRSFWLVLGMIGVAFLFADATITPAISVLSAVEGLEIEAKQLTPFVIPATLVILIALFALQFRGTAKIGAIVGPIMLVWFVVLALLGVGGIVRAPQVLAAVSPAYAIGFLADHGLTGFLVLGGVFLAVTGGEALYADLGHVGAIPMRIAWFALVLPALVLNYFGQAALIFVDPHALRHSFYDLAPHWAHYPLVGLATVATVIASQAVITGSFSMTGQAVRLGLLPRLKIVHTYGEEEGQIYVPAINWLLAAATCGVVLAFGSSANMASAYGVAISMVMVTTTVLAVRVAARWGWSPTVLLPLAGIALVIDLAFVAANAVKIGGGGAYPVVLGFGLLVIMMTWWEGRALVAERLTSIEEPSDAFFERVQSSPPPRISGTAVFLVARPSGVSPLMSLFLTHNKVLHEQAILLHVDVTDAPRVGATERLEIERLPAGILRVVVRYGFMQSPNIPVALRLSEAQGLPVDFADITYFIGRWSIIASEKQPGMMRWRELLYVFLYRNAMRPPDFYNFPPEHTMEISIPMEL
jgi:KUP system potassium uptake protein